MTDDDIIAPGRLLFPDERMIDVHEIWCGQVLYAAHVGDKSWLLRMRLADFIACVRREAGVRSQ